MFTPRLSTTLRMSTIRCTKKVVCVPVRSRNLRSLSTFSGPRVPQTQHALPQSDNYVQVIEVGPRDGLQNEKERIPLATKIKLIERLANTGLVAIEAGSFVAAKWVPQMADSSEILKYILNTPPTSHNKMLYSFLVPNTHGFNSAIAILNSNPGSYQTFSQATQTQPHPSRGTSKPSIEFSVFAAATESFSQKNLNCDIQTSLTRFRPVISNARAAGFRVRAYISAVLGCPFEGAGVDPGHVAKIACELRAIGADEIDLGDTTGMGTAPRTAKLLRHMNAAGIPNEMITMHFHDTYGQALVNAAVSLEHGIRRFDASVGGLGGCPYSPGATGNVSTEDLVYFLNTLGMRTGVDLDALVDIGHWITGEIRKPNSSSVGMAILGRRRSSK